MFFNLKNQSVYLESIEFWRFFFTNRPAKLTSLRWTGSCLKMHCISPFNMRPRIFNFSAVEVHFDKKMTI